MQDGPLSETQLLDYHENGYLFLKSRFLPEEIDLLRRAAKEDKALDDQSYGRQDGEGGEVKLSLWNHPGEDIYGKFVCCKRIVEAAEQILEDEAYHYHSKMIMKDAKVGGAWTWHQDYGYWYENGVLSPNLVSVMIAVDPATKENGCLQVIKGSHKLGRLDHTTTDEQAGANQDRVNEILKRFELVYCEMEPGDALFFHCNILHRSDRNESEHPRWSMICCYNAKSNDPYKESRHPRYTPLVTVEDSAILEAGEERLEAV